MPTLKLRETALAGLERICSIPCGFEEEECAFFISVMEWRAASGGDPEASKKLSMGVNIAAPLVKDSHDESLRFSVDAVVNTEDL